MNEMKKENIVSLVCGTNEKAKREFAKKMTFDFNQLQQSGSIYKCDTKIKCNQIISLQNDIKFQPIPNLTDPTDELKTTVILFNLIEAFKYLDVDFRSIIVLIDNNNSTLEPHDLDEIRMIINFFGEKVVEHLIFVLSPGDKPKAGPNEYFVIETDLSQNFLKTLKSKKIYVKEHQIILNWNNQVDSIKKISSLTYLNDKFDLKMSNKLTMTDRSVSSKVRYAINILLTHYNIKLEEIKELKVLYEKLSDGVAERLYSLTKNYEVWNIIHTELGYLKEQITNTQNIEALLFKPTPGKFPDEKSQFKFPESSNSDLTKIKIIKPPKFKKTNQYNKEVKLVEGIKVMDHVIEG